MRTFLTAGMFRAILVDEFVEHRWESRLRPELPVRAYRCLFRRKPHRTKGKPLELFLFHEPLDRICANGDRVGADLTNGTLVEAAFKNRNRIPNFSSVPLGYNAMSTILKTKIFSVFKILLLNDPVSFDWEFTVLAQPWIGAPTRTFPIFCKEGNDFIIFLGAYFSCQVSSRGTFFIRFRPAFPRFVDCFFRSIMAALSIKRGRNREFEYFFHGKRRLRLRS